MTEFSSDSPLIINQEPITTEPYSTTPATYPESRQFGPQDAETQVLVGAVGTVATASLVFAAWQRRRRQRS